MVLSMFKSFRCRSFGTARFLRAGLVPLILGIACSVDAQTVAPAGTPDAAPASATQTGNFTAQPPIQTGVTGPLALSAVNQRYFADPRGNAGALNGSQTWNTIQDWGANGSIQTLDFSAFVNFLVAHGHN